MSRAYLAEVLDARGKLVTVGCEIAYAVRHWNTAELRIGTVERIEGKRNGRGELYPSVVARFNENERLVHCARLENMVVLS